MTPTASRADAARPTAVVLAGGLGTRMSALSADHPKHLLEVAGEPVVVHQLRWLAAHGVVDVVLATSHLADRFEPVLGDGRRWGVRLRYSTEPTPEGTGGGLRRAARALDPLPGLLVVVNGDLLTGHDLTRQLALGVARPDAAAVLHVRTVPDARPFGCVVAGPGGRVSAFLEKSPDPPGHEVNGGTYVLSRSAVESIPDGTSSLELDVLPRLVSGGSVLAYREDALWEDVGTPAALVRASRALVLGSGRDAHVDPTAYPALAVKTIPAQSYARFAHHGPPRDIALSLAYLYHTWLPQSGQRLASPLEIESYEENPIRARRATIDIPIRDPSSP